MNRKVSTPNFIKKVLVQPGEFPRASSVCGNQNNLIRPESGCSTHGISSYVLQQQPKVNNPPLVSALSAAVFCQNRILYNKNAHEGLEVASLTKVMTFYCALKLAARYDFESDKILVKVPRFAAFICGTSACLRNAEYIRLTDLFYALMLPSGNDAACTIANFFGYLDLQKKSSPSAFYNEEETAELMELYDISDEGELRFQQFQGDVQMNIKNFVKIMNSEAQKLQMKSTIYSNPHGLSDKGNKSSALDYGRLCHFAMAQFELFRKVVKTPHHSCIVFLNREYLLSKKAAILAAGLQNNNSKPLVTSRKTKWENTNKLLTKSQYFIGIKTGCTPNAGHCLATHYQKNNIDLQVIVLKSKDSEKKWSDSLKLAEWMYLILQAEQTQQSQELGVEEQYQQSAKQRILSPAKRKIKFSYNFERILNNNESSNLAVIEQVSKPQSMGVITQYIPQPQVFFQQNTNLRILSATKRIENTQTLSQTIKVCPVSRKQQETQGFMGQASGDQRLKTCQEKQGDRESSRDKMNNTSQMFVQRNKSAAPYLSESRSVKMNKNEKKEKIPQKKKPMSSKKTTSSTIKSTINNDSQKQITISEDLDKSMDQCMKNKTGNEEEEDKSSNDEDQDQITFRVDKEEENDNSQMLSDSFDDKMEEFLENMRVVKSFISKQEQLEDPFGLKQRSLLKIQNKQLSDNFIKPACLKPKTASNNGRDQQSLPKKGLNKLFTPRRKFFYAHKQWNLQSSQQQLQHQSDFNKIIAAGNQLQIEFRPPPAIQGHSFRQHSAVSRKQQRLPVVALNQSVLSLKGQRSSEEREEEKY